MKNKNKMTTSINNSEYIVNHLKKLKEKAVTFAIEASAKSAIESFEEKNYMAAIHDLTFLRNIAISEKTNPQYLHASFIDFLEDDSMWAFVKELENRPKITNDDITGIIIILQDLIEIKKNKEFFVTGN